MSIERALRRQCGRRALLRLAAGGAAALLAPASTLAAGSARSRGVRLNVRDFGAIGNGVADDTAAIARAIDAGQAVPQATVYFPAGTYLVTEALDLPGPITLSGASATTTRLLLKSGSTLLTISNTSDVALAQLALDGGHHDDSYGVWVNDARNVSISGCAFTNFTNCAVSVQRVDGVRIWSSTFHGIGWSGVRLEDPGADRANRYVYVQSCAFEHVVMRDGAGHAAVQAHDNPSATNDFVWIQNNLIRSNGVGIGLDSVRHATLTGNRIFGNSERGEGIAICGDNNLVSRNVVSCNAAAGILQWAVSYRSNDDNVVADNICYDNAQGIAVVCANDGAVIRNLTIARNRCFSQSETHPQAWGIQAYIDGATNFEWNNVHIDANDLRGNVLGGISLIPPAKAILEGNLS